MAILSIFSKKVDDRTGTIAEAGFEENSPVLTDETFVNIRDLIYKNCGIFYTADKKELVYERLLKILPELNISSFEEYYKLLVNSREQSQIIKLISVITINETYFFRNYQQFEVLEKYIIPEIINTKSSEKEPVVRIWSCAASTGEEAYTMAIYIQARIKYIYPKVTFQILATDINPKAITDAQKGIYSEFSLRKTPQDVRDRFFKQKDNLYYISDELKQLVRFTAINLNDPEQIKKVRNCDIVLCCNMLVYFDSASRQQVLSGLYDSLNKGGYLLVGYSESLHGVSHKFKLLHFPKTLVYKKD